MKTRRTKSDECAEWLLDMLSDGPVGLGALVEAGETRGFNKTMIWRTRNAMAGQIGDVHGHMHPGNLWQLDPHYAPGPRARSAEDQIAALNDWLAEHDPDLYWGTPELDTAAVVIAALEHKLSRARLVELLAIELDVTVEIIP